MRRYIEGNPGAELLLELFSYDPLTGDIRHKARRHGTRHGEIAGSVRKTDGYRVFHIFQRTFYAQQIAWCMFYGEWPPIDIDHENCTRDDNRISNLRLASVTMNRANCKRRADASSKYKGLTRIPSGKWRSQIGKNGVSKYLGVFSTQEEAHAAYVAAAVREFGEFANAG